MLAFGDVSDDAEKNFLSAKFDNARVDLHRHYSPVFSQVGRLKDRLAVLDDLCETLGNPRSELRRINIPDTDRKHLFLCITKPFMGRLVDVDETALHVQDKDTIGRLIEKHPEFRFGLSYRLFRLPELGDVSEGAVEN